jgi:hypothetical protein
MTMHHEHIPGHAPHKRHAGKKTGADAEELATDKQIDEGLQAIYGDDRSDLHVVERDGSRLTRILTRLVLFLAAAAILGFGGFFVYSTYFASNSSDTSLAMSIEAPTEVKSGEEVEIIVHYSNPSRIPLASLELDVNLPAAFALASAQPEPTQVEDLLWTIGSLGGHSDGQLTLRGVWLSGVPSTTTVQTLATYRPSNFNSNFSDIATTTITTLSSVLTLEVTGPESAVPGQALEYTATIKNTGAHEVQGAALALTFPEGFILSESTPALEAGSDTVWELGTFLPEAEVKVSWQGVFAADVSDIQQFTSEVTVAENDRDLSQASNAWFTDVAGSDVQTTLVINGSSDKATTELGGTLRVSIRLENAGEEPVSGTSILLDFKPDSGIPIIWGSAALDGGKLTSSGIAFDAALVGTLAPGAKKTYNLSFPIKDILGANEVDEWNVTAYVTTAGSTVQTAPFPVSMKATVDLSASARFYSENGGPLGEGPLPPKVGQATMYRVFWSLGQAVHDLEDIVVTATIPSHVSFDDRVTSSLGSLQYDEASQIVRWDIAALAANESATAEFTVKMVPGQEDIGTFVKLLSGTVLQATDTDTEASVDATAEILTTEIPEDTFAAGKGTVID